MTPDRWNSALESGAVVLPDDGRVLVMRARADARLEPLGKDRVLAVQGFAPDHARLAARGFTVAVAPEGMFAAALVQIVKSKRESLSLIAEALAHVTPGGPILIDGQKTEGIESLLKTLRAVLPIDDVISKAHGKLIVLHRPETLPEAVAEWPIGRQVVEGGFVTVPGGFSADGPDQGSELLIALVPALKGQVADLGAGWGYIAAILLQEQPGIASLDLIEADWAVLQAARENVTDPRARFHWADATAFEPEAAYDAIVCNPPFHTGRKADPDIGRAFIAAAARMLKPSGQFFMVANRHLPYEAALKSHFATGKMLAEMQGFKLYQAAKPTRGTP